MNCYRCGLWLNSPQVCPRCGLNMAAGPAPQQPPPGMGPTNMPLQGPMSQPSAPTQQPSANPPGPQPSAPQASAPEPDDSTTIHPQVSADDADATTMHPQVPADGPAESTSVHPQAPADEPDDSTTLHPQVSADGPSDQTTLHPQVSAPEPSDHTTIRPQTGDLGAPSDTGPTVPQAPAPQPSPVMPGIYREQQPPAQSYGSAPYPPGSYGSAPQSQPSAPPGFPQSQPSAPPYPGYPQSQPSAPQSQASAPPYPVQSQPSAPQWQQMPQSQPTPYGADSQSFGYQPSAAPTAPASEDDSEEKSKGKAGWIVAICILTLALAGGLFFLWTWLNGESDTAEPAPPPSASEAETSAEPSEEPSQEPSEEPSEEPSAEPSEEPSPEPSTNLIEDATIEMVEGQPIDAFEAERFLKAYYALAVADPASAWEFQTSYRQSQEDYDNYVEWWSSVESVDVSLDALTGNTTTSTVTFHMENGSSSDETISLPLAAEDGIMKVHREGQDDTLPFDNHEEAKAVLNSIYDADKSKLRIDGKWVAVLSTKKAGIVDESQTAYNGSHTFHEGDILYEHLLLDEQYSGDTEVLLVSSDDFGKRSSSTFWRTIYDGHWDSEEEAQAWCNANFSGSAEQIKNNCLPAQLNESHD